MVAGLTATVALLLIVGSLISTHFGYIANERTEVAIAEAERNRHLLYASDMNVALQAWEQDNLDRATELLRRHVPKSSAHEDLRGFEWYYLWARYRDHLGPDSLPYNAKALAYSPDG